MRIAMLNHIYHISLFDQFIFSRLFLHVRKNIKSNQKTNQKVDQKQ